MNLGSSCRKCLITGVVVMSLLLLSGCKRSTQSYLERGQSYIQKGDYESARIEFLNAVNQDPRSAEAHHRLAQAYLAQRNGAEALQNLQIAADLDPNNVEIRLEMAQLYVAGGEYDKAESTAQEVLTEISQNPNSQSANQQTANQQGALAYQVIGESWERRLSHDKAIAAFTKSTELDPGSASAQLNLGLAEIAVQHYPPAQQALLRAIALNPKFVQAYLTLANLYHAQSQLKETEQTLRQGIAQNPDAQELYILCATLLYEEHQADSARSVLDSLANRPTNSADAALAVGDFYLRHHDATSALAEYQRGIKQFPKDLDLKNHTVDADLVANRTEEA